MSVMLADAKGKLQCERKVILSSEVPVHELVYADDTLLIDVRSDTLQAYMDCVEEFGAEYGLALNWQKIEVLPARREAAMTTLNGSAVKQKDNMFYLGALLSADGRVGSELSRRLGMAQADFKALAQVWKHTLLSRRDKYDVFMSLVVSKFMYALETTWLNVSERRKLDGMFARCLRRIAGVLPSFLSRVSNKEVLRRFDSPALSVILLERQLGYFGKLAALPASSTLRSLVFQPDSILPIEPGKSPRMYWSGELHRAALKLAGTAENLKKMTSNPRVWKSHVRDYCRK
jgi:hypothetical protein